MRTSILAEISARDAAAGAKQRIATAKILFQENFLAILFSFQMLEFFVIHENVNFFCVAFCKLYFHAGGCTNGVT